MNCCLRLPAWRFWSIRRFLLLPSPFRAARRRRLKHWGCTSILCMRAAIVISMRFERLIELQVGALVIGNDTLFTIHKEQLAKLTVRHAIPAIYQYPEFVAAGGLMSYGTSETEYYRLVGTYAGRVLK